MGERLFNGVGEILIRGGREFYTVIMSPLGRYFMGETI